MEIYKSLEECESNEGPFQQQSEEVAGGDVVS